MLPAWSSGKPQRFREADVRVGGKRRDSCMIEAAVIILAIIAIVNGFMVRHLVGRIVGLEDNKVSNFRFSCQESEVKDLKEKLYAMERHVGVSLTYNPLPEKYSYVKTY